MITKYENKSYVYNYTHIFIYIISNYMIYMYKLKLPFPTIQKIITMYLRTISLVDLTILGLNEKI